MATTPARAAAARRGRRRVASFLGEGDDRLARRRLLLPGVPRTGAKYPGIVATPTRPTTPTPAWSSGTTTDSSGTPAPAPPRRRRLGNGAAPPYGCPRRGGTHRRRRERAVGVGPRRRAPPLRSLAVSYQLASGSAGVTAALVRAASAAARRRRRTSSRSTSSPWPPSSESTRRRARRRRRAAKSGEFGRESSSSSTRATTSAPRASTPSPATPSSAAAAPTATATGARRRRAAATAARRPPPQRAAACAAVLEPIWTCLRGEGGRWGEEGWGRARGEHGRTEAHSPLLKGGGGPAHLGVIPAWSATRRGAGRSGALVLVRHDETSARLGRQSWRWDVILMVGFLRAERVTVSFTGRGAFPRSRAVRPVWVGGARVPRPGGIIARGRGRHAPALVWPKRRASWARRTGGLALFFGPSQRRVSCRWGRLPFTTKIFCGCLGRRSMGRGRDGAELWPQPVPAPCIAGSVDAYVKVRHAKELRGSAPTSSWLWPLA